MRKFISFVYLILFFGLSFSAYAAPDGVGHITDLGFAGPHNPHHPNVVQFRLKANTNGSDSYVNFSNPNCSPYFAAVRKGDGHLISGLLTAASMYLEVKVYLTSADYYYDVNGDRRCTVSGLTVLSLN